MHPGRFDKAGVTFPEVVPADAYDAVIWHARACLPQEACGLVAVDAAGAVRMVYPLTNAEGSAIRFTIAPAEHFGAVTHCERQGWEIGAVFHSHPRGPAVPSPTDLAQPHDPRWLHFVVGFEPAPHLRCWRIRDGMADEVAVEVRPDARTAS